MLSSGSTRYHHSMNFIITVTVTVTSINFRYPCTTSTRTLTTGRCSTSPALTLTVFTLWILQGQCPSRSSSSSSANIIIITNNYHPQVSICVRTMPMTFTNPVDAAFAYSLYFGTLLPVASTSSSLSSPSSSSSSITPIRYILVYRGLLDGWEGCVSFAALALKQCPQPTNHHHHHHQPIPGLDRRWRGLVLWGMGERTLARLSHQGKSLWSLRMGQAQSHIM